SSDVCSSDLDRQRAAYGLVFCRVLLLVIHILSAVAFPRAIVADGIPSRIDIDEAMAFAHCLSICWALHAVTRVSAQIQGRAPGCPNWCDKFPSRSHIPAADRPCLQRTVRQIRLVL